MLKHANYGFAYYSYFGVISIQLTHLVADYAYR